MSEPPPQHTVTSNIPAWIPSPPWANAVASTSTISPVPRTSEDIPIDPRLLDSDTPLPASATLEPDMMDLLDSSSTLLSTDSMSYQPIADNPASASDQREVFELFHDALELVLTVDSDHNDTLLMVTSTSTDEAADALYPCLRQLFATGKVEPLPPFSATSICNLDIKALDRTKISANM